MSAQTSRSLKLQQQVATGNAIAQRGRAWAAEPAQSAPRAPSEPESQGHRQGKRAGGARQQQQPERERPTPPPAHLTGPKPATSVPGGQALHSKLEILLEQQSSNCLISKLRLLSPRTETQILSSGHAVVPSTKVSKSKPTLVFSIRFFFLVLLDKGSYLHCPLRQESGRK